MLLAIQSTAGDVLSVSAEHSSAVALDGDRLLVLQLPVLHSVQVVSCHAVHASSRDIYGGLYAIMLDTTMIGVIGVPPNCGPILIPDIPGERVHQYKLIICDLITRRPVHLRDQFHIVMRLTEREPAGLPAEKPVERLVESVEAGGV